ncbi:MAG: DHH family phosphoesterase [Nitrososphaerales archaeon]
MQSIITRFSNTLQGVAQQLEDYEAKEAMVIHHDEADGLCSGAICKRMLEKLGYSVSNLCLDKLFPEVIKNLHAKEHNLYVYADMGSAHAPLISSYNKSRNFTLILDHHDPAKSEDPLVYNINPEFQGMSGESDASASSVAYFFAKKLNNINEDLAHLAIIGTAEIPGPIKGLNKYVLDDAIKNRQVEIKKTKSGEDVKILSVGRSYKRISTMLSVLGSVGYYRDGPSMGMKACLESFDSEIESSVEKFEKERKQANQRLLEELRLNGLNQLKGIQWFHAGDNYNGMSGKVIGSFCSYLRFQRIVNPMKYLIGMMNMPQEIPGYGNLNKQYMKISSRVSERLAQLINRKNRPALSKILPEACSKFDGFGDGHSVAASGVILKGKEGEFVKELDLLATQEISSGRLDTFFVKA